MLTRNLTFSLALALGAGLIVATPAAQKHPGPAKIRGFDATFAKKAAVGNMAEVKLGQYASKHAASKEMRDFGLRMVADHGRAQMSLKAIATVKNFELPKQLDPKHRKVWEKLSSLKGPAFDAAYRAAMVTAHKEAVALNEGALPKLKDNELKDYVRTTLPVVKSHLEHLMAGSGH